MSIPTFNPVRPRRRRGRTQTAVVAPPLSALHLSSVKDANFDGPSGQMVAVFDVSPGQSLVDPASADPAKWTVRFNETIYLATSFQFDGGNELTIFFGDYGSEAGPNVVSYAADPSDIEDTQGRMLAAFENFPI